MLVERILILTACIFLLFVAWEDFRKFKVRNSSVLILIGLYAAFAAVRAEFDPVVLDFGAGLLLFVLGVVFWLFGLMGAGDAKLFFPVGCWVSLHNLAGWAMLLLLCSFVMLILVKVKVPLPLRHYAFFMRLDDFRHGKVPYGVPISMATVISLLPNVFL